MRNLDFTSDSPQSIKLGDSSDTLSLRVTELGQPVDLSKASSITVKIGNTAGYLTEIDVDVSSLIHPTIGRIDIDIDSKISSELPAGNYLLEVWIDDALGNTAIYPDTSYPSVIGFSIKKNIMAATSTVITTLTLADFEAKFDDMQKDLQSKVTSGYFKGDKGDTGVGVSSSTVTYQLSSSGTTTPTGTWSSSALAQTTALPYLWTKTVITYSNSTTTTMYSVSSKGDTGTVDNAGLTNAPAFQALQTQVNNSAVGTNLLTGTSDFSSNWNGQSSVSTTTEYNGYPSMVFTSSSLQLAFQNVGKIQNSTQHIASFWAKADNAGDKAHTELWGGIGRADFVLTTNWVRYTAVVTSYSDANTNVAHSPCFFGVPDGNGNKGNVYIALPKLEKGSVATDWCPAASEVLTQSDYAKIKAAIVALGGSLS